MWPFEVFSDDVLVEKIVGTFVKWHIHVVENMTTMFPLPLSKIMKGVQKMLESAIWAAQDIAKLVGGVNVGDP